MERISDEQLRKLLGQFTVSSPRNELVAETKRLMRQEMALQAAPARKGQAGMVLVMVALSLLVCFNLFYVATVGTLLKLLLPSSLEVYLNHSLFGISAAAAALVCGMVITVFFKTFQPRRALSLT
jgi:hypothetical protein